MMMSKDRESAILGGGCFWCLEAVYEQIEGVEEVVSGYAGGEVPNPTYEQVCSGGTGHAEVVRISYDPAVVTFRDLLDIFFTIHDPTTLNRQGADVGTQYRSVIYYLNDEQRELARSAIEELVSSGVWAGTVVTELEPAPEFFTAEKYHQGYYGRNSDQPYCQAVITPKLSKLRKAHFDRLRRSTVEDQREAEDQVRPFLGQPRNPLDHGGIAE
jgi:peptide-methionine (S)-S-oxide reductase